MTTMMCRACGARAPTCICRLCDACSATQQHGWLVSVGARSVVVVGGKQFDAIRSAYEQVRETAPEDASAVPTSVQVSFTRTSTTQFPGAPDRFEAWLYHMRSGASLGKLSGTTTVCDQWSSGRWRSTS